MDKVTMHADICKELTDLYRRKNADYGDSFGKSYKEYGMTMACIRLEDKLNRLKSLTKNAAQVEDESIEDTLSDLANYAIMTLVERREEGTHEAIERGNHNEICRTYRDKCICNKCKNDNFDCCTNTNHKKRECPVTECPDFTPEGE